MIEYRTGDIWESGADAIVIPVNCYGVMETGLALQCRQRYPDVYENYKRACADGLTQKGRCERVPLCSSNPSALYLAATKLHCKYPSKIEWVRDCIIDLRFIAGNQKPLELIAVPKLGCGRGGLSWDDVKPFMHKWLGEQSPTQTFLVYE